MKTSKQNRISRRGFIGLLVAAGLSITATGLVWRDSYKFKINRQTIKLAKLKQKIKIVQLSDFHYGEFIKEKDLEKWIDTSIAQNPDLILITGDFIDSSTTEFDGIIRQLSRLNAPLGVYGIWGNHDYNSGSMRKRFEQELNTIGIEILVNSGKQIRTDIYLAGVDDLYNGKPDIKKALLNKAKDSLCLHMSHNPDYLFNIPQSVDFSFCGHTHGGQVNLPIIGAPYIPSAYGQKFIGGLVKSPVKAFVSKGLGFTALPIRFNARAEIIVFELLPS